MTQKIVLYDTTLRDGTQAEDVNLSTPDKIKIALRLDEFGIDYIEGGWPGSNPVDVAFFKEIANYHLKYARQQGGRRPESERAHRFRRDGGDDFRQIVRTPCEGSPASGPQTESGHHP